MKAQLIKKAVELYKLTLNTNSKFYADDVRDFKANISGLSETQINEKISRLNAITSNKSTFNKSVEKEMRKMDNAGMFNVSSMAPKNALD